MTEEQFLQRIEEYFGDHDVGEAGQGTKRNQKPEHKIVYSSQIQRACVVRSGPMSGLRYLLRVFMLDKQAREVQGWAGLLKESWRPQPGIKPAQFTYFIDCKPYAIAVVLPRLLVPAVIPRVSLGLSGIGPWVLSLHENSGYPVDMLRTLAETAIEYIRQQGYTTAYSCTAYFGESEEAVIFGRRALTKISWRAQSRTQPVIVSFSTAALHDAPMSDV